MTKPLNNIKITPKIDFLGNAGLPHLYNISRQSELFEPVLHESDEITNNPELLNSLAKLVQEGLTIYGQDFDAALEDLKQHLEKAKAVIFFDFKKVPIGFAIYKSLNSKFLDISFIVSANHRNKGLGAKLIEIAVAEFDHQYIVASTQNVATFMAFKKVFKSDLLTPVLRNGKLSEIDKPTFEIAAEALKLKGGKDLNQDASITNYYPENGLYGEDINLNSDFPIDAKSSRAIILVAKNPKFTE